MTNQAAQTMPPLPKSFGEHCVYDSVRVMREPGYTADQMHQYARDYAALAQNAGVAEAVRSYLMSNDLYSLLTDIQNGIDSPATMGTANSLIVRLDRLRDMLAAAPAASGGEDGLAAGIMTHFCNAIDNLNDMPVSEEWAAEWAAKAEELIGLSGVATPTTPQRHPASEVAIVCDWRDADPLPRFIEAEVNGRSVSLEWRDREDGLKELIVPVRTPSDYPECSGDPASCPENEGHGCCKPNPQRHPDALEDGSLSKSTAKRLDTQRLAQGDGCGACGDACADRGSCQVADDSPPTQPPHQDRGEVEAVAKVIYEQWEHEPGYVKWTDGGNSFKQDHARTLARAALTEAKQQGRTEPEVCPQCFWVNPKQQGPGGAGRSTSYSREALEIQGARWRAFCRTLDHVAPGWDSGLHGAVEVASAAVRELSAYAARMALDGAAAPQVEAKRQAGEGE